jgi:hypothetical protein
MVASDRYAWFTVWLPTTRRITLTKGLKPAYTGAFVRPATSKPLYKAALEHPQRRSSMPFRKLYCNRQYKQLAGSWLIRYGF